MGKRTLRKILIIPLLLIFGATLIGTAACTPEEMELLKGVLENVDSAKGTVTIVTDDGKTVTVKINTETEITSDGDNKTAVKLEAGAPVEIRVKKDEQVAKRIETRKDAVRVERGILEIRVTDPPPAAVKSAEVFYNSIEVHRATGHEGHSANTTDSGNATAITDDFGWITVISTPGSFDLMSIIGAEKILGAASLPTGNYTQIRLDVTKVSGITADNTPYTAEVPGDKLKIVGNFAVGSANKTAITLDFDGEKSLIQTGQGKFIFKPVVKLLVNSKGKITEIRKTPAKPEAGDKPAMSTNATNSKRDESDKPKVADNATNQKNEQERKPEDKGK